MHLEEAQKSFVKAKDIIQGFVMPSATLLATVAQQSVGGGYNDIFTQSARLRGVLQMQLGVIDQALG